MRVFWKTLWRINLNTFTFKVLLITTTHALLKESWQQKNTISGWYMQWNNMKNI